MIARDFIPIVTNRSGDARLDRVNKKKTDRAAGS